MSTPVERLRALPFFRPEDYLALNPDLRLAAIDPADHAFRHGLAEGRPIFRREALARAWGVADTGRTAPSWAGSAAEEIAPDACPSVTVFVSTASNVSDVALATDLAETLTSSGIDATVKDQSENPAADHGLPIVVAPHTFFEFGLGALWARTDAIERSLTFNTAAMDQHSFSRALPWILRARGVMEASPQAAGIFEAAGLHALLMRFGRPLRTAWLEPSDLLHPLVQALPEAARRLDIDLREWDNRPIDVAFFDVLSDRRGAVLRRQAATLAQRPTFLYAAQGGRDLVDENVERRSYHRLAGHVSAYAKITLHLAETEFPHFDWHRCITQTMAFGSVAVSDTRPSHPDHAIGEHVFHADERHIGELTRWLLDDPDGRRAASNARLGAAQAIDRSDPAFLSQLRRYLAAASRPNSA